MAASHSTRNTSTRLFFCLVVVSSVCLKCALGLYCYQCGIATDGSDRCDLTPETGSYVVECHVGDYCSKTISHRWENDVDKPEETRGCAAPTTISGKRHEMGCFVDQRSGAVVCYCNSDHCNSAQAKTRSSVVTTITMVAVSMLTSCIITFL